MILDELAYRAFKRVEEQKKMISLEEMKELAQGKGDTKPFAFEKALCKNNLAFICEVKKASPSKSVIAEEFPYSEIAADYEYAGADCISVLTEPTRFLGKDEYLLEISKQVQIPLLRKDFTVDEYMIYQAKTLGASAVLLICALLDTQTLKKYIALCDRLELSALVEAHDEKEITSAVKAGARMIGVNNRNLKDFTVDIHNCIRLKKYIPEDVIYVAESGIKTAADIARIWDAGIDAVLIGETLMRAKNKKKELETLKGGHHEN
ncbi:indole-3-glycerol phosphate synthase TrpC [Anaerotignum sp.]|uniref:indole-3-glycerol phosphate synthase TrpC n=1 Tax=Anaerotignum sp. TaxID=2039241 RepID=UPI002ED1D392